MKKLTIKYNPYCITTEFTVDGSLPKADSALHVGNSRIQEWADQLPDWLGKEFKEKNWNILFVGTEDDYADLQSGFSQTKSGVKAKFSIKPMPDVDEAEKAIDQLFAEIQRGPISELKSKDIREAFEKAKNQEFEISVVATVNSGKSTLVNALLGRELMPSANEATTATIVRIVDDDDAKSFTAKAYNAQRKLLKTVKNVTLEQMQVMNKDEKISFIDLVGPIPFVSASGMRLVLVDTPGPNNARNREHQRMTYNMIGADRSMVLFVMDGQQLGTDDGTNLINYVCNCMKKGGKQSKDRFLFVVNKVNCLDPQTKHDGPGCVRRFLNNAKKDLENCGIRNPNIFPVAALPALQLREEDRFGMELQRYKMFSDAFDEMRFDQYTDFMHIPASMQSRIEELKKQVAPEHLTEINTGIFSLEQAITLYVKKYARTTKVMDLVLAFNSKLEELSAEASLRETLRKDQAAKAEMEKQVNVVRKNIEAARGAKTFSAKVDKLDLVSGAQQEVTALFKGLRTDISKMMAGRETKVELDKALLQCAEIERKSQSICAQLHVQVDKIVVDTYKRTVEEIIAEYKKYLIDLNMGSASEKLKLNPLKLVASEVGKLDMNTLVKEHSEVKEVKDVKVESNLVKTGSSTFGNTVGGSFWGAVIGGIIGTIIPIPGFGTTAGAYAGAAIGGWFGNKRGDTTSYEVKTRTIELPRKVTYVNMSEVASEFLQPIQEKLAIAEKNILDYVKYETVEVKAFVSRKLQEIDKVLDSKLNTLARYETGVKEKEAVIAESQRQLKWLEDIEKRVNSIVYY